MEPKIIYQDNFLLVLDKPSGWIVNEADTTKDSPVIQTWLRNNFDYEIVNSSVERSGIVHRIDKETSGILLVAKNRNTFYDLQEQFKERVVKKTYLALVHGKLFPLEGEIKTTVGRLPWNREKFGVLPGGREAVTRYKVINHYTPITDHRSLFTFLILYPETGRTHQIRIHLKYLGHPIVSDVFYAGRKTARNDRKWCPRLFLHAAEINFTHPVSNNKLNFKTNLPADLETALDLLEINS